MAFGIPPSSEYGTHTTVKARFWPCLPGESPNVFKFLPLRSSFRSGTWPEWRAGLLEPLVVNMIKSILPQNYVNFWKVRFVCETFRAGFCPEGNQTARQEGSVVRRHALLESAYGSGVVVSDEIAPPALRAYET